MSLFLTIEMVISLFPAYIFAEALVPEPVTEPVTEPETEPVTEPVIVLETEPATEPETEPVTEPETKPETEAATVTFLYEPEWLTLVVFPAEEKDESTAIAPPGGRHLFADARGLCLSGGGRGL